MIFRSSILFGENDIITAHRASVQSIRLACLILDQEFCSVNRVGYDTIADIHTLEKQRQNVFAQAQCTMVLVAAPSTEPHSYIYSIDKIINSVQAFNLKKNAL